MESRWLSSRRIYCIHSRILRGQSTSSSCQVSMTLRVASLLPLTTFEFCSLCPRLGMGQLAFLQDGLQTLIMPPTAVSQIPDHSEYYTLQHVAYLQLSLPTRLNPFFSPQMGLRSLGANRGHSSQTPL